MATPTRKCFYWVASQTPIAQSSQSPSGSQTNRTGDGTSGVGWVFLCIVQNVTKPWIVYGLTDHKSTAGYWINGKIVKISMTNCVAYEDWGWAALQLSKLLARVIYLYHSYFKPVVQPAADLKLHKLNQSSLIKLLIKSITSVLIVVNTPSWSSFWIFFCWWSF